MKGTHMQAIHLIAYRGALVSEKFTFLLIGKTKHNIKNKRLYKSIKMTDIKA